MHMKIKDIAPKQVVMESGDILEVISIDEAIAGVNEMLHELDDKSNQRVQEGPEKAPRR